MILLISYLLTVVLAMLGFLRYWALDEPRSMVCHGLLMCLFAAPIMLLAIIIIDGEIILDDAKKLLNWLDRD